MTVALAQMPRLPLRLRGCPQRHAERRSPSARGGVDDEARRRREQRDPL